MTENRYWTFEEVDAKIRGDLDIINDDFVTEDQMIAYANDAVREAEAAIHNLGMEDDYFLNLENLSFISGQSEYVLPFDMYANKIRGFIYTEGLAKNFEVRPYKRFGKFGSIAIDSNLTDSGTGFQYYIKNPSPNEDPTITVVPTPNVSGEYGRLWYIRRAMKVKNVQDKIDIPEFISFIMAHMKKSVLTKRMELTPDVLKEYEDKKLQMLETLREQTDDDNSDVYMDLSHYRDHT